MYTSEQLAILIEGECSNLQLSSEPNGLFEPIRYIMADGGKRLRPLLTLMAANIFSDDIRPALGSALAVEVFHNFTLLHDDIMDRAPMRRGRETVHRRWNDNTAILSGDAMMPIAYDLLCNSADSNKLASLLQTFNRSVLDVCRGQQYDMDFENQDGVTIDQYLEMIQLKTAALMAAGLEMGAISVAASQVQQQAIFEFGLNLGIAFQIQDDLLDTYGDSKTFGKTVGGDIAVGKQTFLMITALDKASENQSALLRTSRDYATVREIYDLLDVQKDANNMIDSYFARALANLVDVSDDDERLEPMKIYATKLMGRIR